MFYLNSLGDISIQVIRLPRVMKVAALLSGSQPSMITLPVNILLPERTDLSGGNLPVKWQRFCRAWSN